MNKCNISSPTFLSGNAHKIFLLFIEHYIPDTSYVISISIINVVVIFNSFEIFKQLCQWIQF